jgi:hypothetical protein
MIKLYNVGDTIMETKIYIIPLSNKLKNELRYRIDISLGDDSFVEDNENIEYLQSLRNKLDTVEKTIFISNNEVEWIEYYLDEFEGNDVYSGVQRDIKRIYIALKHVVEVTQEELKDRCFLKGGRSVWGKPDFRLDGKMYNYN